MKLFVAVIANIVAMLAFTFPSFEHCIDSTLDATLCKLNILFVIGSSVAMVLWPIFRPAPWATSLMRLGVLNLVAHVPVFATHALIYAGYVSRFSPDSPQPDAAYSPPAAPAPCALDSLSADANMVCRAQHKVLHAGPRCQAVLRKAQTDWNAAAADANLNLYTMLGLETPASAHSLGIENRVVKAAVTMKSNRGDRMTGEEQGCRVLVDVATRILLDRELRDHYHVLLGHLLDATIMPHSSSRGQVNAALDDACCEDGCGCMYPDGPPGRRVRFHLDPYPDNVVALYPRFDLHDRDAL